MTTQITIAQKKASLNRSWELKRVSHNCSRKGKTRSKKLRYVTTLRRWRKKKLSYIKARQPVLHREAWPLIKSTLIVQYLKLLKYQVLQKSLKKLINRIAQSSGIQNMVNIKRLKTINKSE
jgi:hypothetical protein